MMWRKIDVHEREKERERERERERVEGEKEGVRNFKRKIKTVRALREEMTGYSVRLTRKVYINSLLFPYQLCFNNKQCNNCRIEKSLTKRKFETQTFFIFQ